MGHWTGLLEETLAPERVTSPVTILGFLRNRRAAIDQFLQGALDVPLALTTPDPLVVSSSTATLRGTAPFKAAFFVVAVGDADAETTEVQWLPPEAPGATVPITWELTVSGLDAHENEVELLVSDRAGSLLGLVSLTIINTASPTSFTRGEVNGDGVVNVDDALQILGYLFQRGRLTCRDSADADDDGRLNISDPIRLLLYLFAGGNEPPPPFPGAGADPTPDTLGCDAG